MQPQAPQQQLAVRLAVQPLAPEQDGRTSPREQEVLAQRLLVEVLTNVEGPMPLLVLHLLLHLQLRPARARREWHQQARPPRTSWQVDLPPTGPPSAALPMPMQLPRQQRKTRTMTMQGAVRLRSSLHQQRLHL